MVSNTSAENMFDYVVGVYYEKQVRTGSWTIAIPGSPERAALLGQDILVGPNDENFQQIDTQNFTDKSVFGELTYHFLTPWSDYLRRTAFPAGLHRCPVLRGITPFPRISRRRRIIRRPSKTVGKVDPSYEYAKDQYVYALWSQGFRRGGANSVPQAGPFAESPLLATYKPDKTNNYETGLKGRFSNGMSYTVDYFYIKWDNPQISSSLPSGNLAVYNANTGLTPQGFEFETSGPLLVQGLGYSIGFSYADAKLTSDFSLPANVEGVITPGALTGTKGEQMPGSPEDQRDRRRCCTTR